MSVRASLACAFVVAAATAQAQPRPQRDGAALYESVLARIAAHEAQHASLVRRVEIGASAAARPLFVLRLGSAADGAPEVFFGAGMHGNEGSEEDALWLLDRLLGAAAEPPIAELLRTRVLWVAPLLNPDGVVAQQRKNANGVDLNRNFAVGWLAARDPAQRDYPGAEAFSEPESKALRDFLRARRHLRSCVDLHRSMRALVPARGADLAVDPRTRWFADELDAAMGAYSMRTHGRLPNLLAMRGLLVDWVWGELGVFAVVMENSDAAPQRAAAADPRWRCLLHLLRRAADPPHYPFLVTAATRADAVELLRLQQPGSIVCRDDFESQESFAHWFEIGGEREGRVRISREPEAVHGGSGSLQLTSTANGGQPCGAGPMRWLGDDGHDVLHLRYWLRYAPDYDQGNLNHTGGWLAGVAGTDKWAGLGSAGERPAGDDHFSTSVEGWRDWQRVPAPGFLFSYTYWMDMKRDRDGNWWGNMLGPADGERFVPERGKWLCVEQRVAVNTPGNADGELAVWLDGKLYTHHRGFRWRSSEAVRIKRIWLLAYVHAATRDNTVWFDDVVASTGYVGTGDVAAPAKGK